MWGLGATAIGAALFLSACSDWNSRATYSLYRGSVAGNFRIHIATSDADQNEEYNRENCQLAADLFKRQPGVTVKFWCEKGRYRP